MNLEGLISDSFMMLVSSSMRDFKWLRGFSIFANGDVSGLLLLEYVVSSLRLVCSNITDFSYPLCLGNCA